MAFGILLSLVTAFVASIAGARARAEGRSLENAYIAFVLAALDGIVWIVLHIMFDLPTSPADGASAAGQPAAGPARPGQREPDDRQRREEQRVDDQHLRPVHAAQRASQYTVGASTTPRPGVDQAAGAVARGQADAAGDEQTGRGEVREAGQRELGRERLPSSRSSSSEAPKASSSRPRSAAPAVT